MATPRKLFPILLVLLLCAAPSVAGQELADRYRDTAGRLIGAALTDEEGWEKLVWLTDRIGHRLSGSPGLERAIDWAAEGMRRDGLENVRLQPVEVTHWVRGDESAVMLEPTRRSLPMLGLGGSVGTPEGGITAEVVVVRDFAALEALPRDAVVGRIVLFDPPWEGYGTTVRYRVDGAVAAARKGAVAALIRSVGPVSLQTPHTGGMRYDEDVERIPAAALTVEDAAWIHRLHRRGVTPVVRLQMGARTLPDAESANVMGEIVGAQLPDEIVVLGGHIDSWDVGQGAHDDGAGCIAAWQAVTLMKQLDLRPRRTVRVVLWTNEENGLAGGRAYRGALAEDVDDHVAAIEMDIGAERPVGFGLGLPVEGEAAARAYALADEIGTLLEGIDAGRILRGGGGADIGPLMRAGVPGFGLRTVGEHYFDWHHTEADTLDKVDRDDFRRSVAALAVLAYVLADMPGRLVEAP